MLRLCNRWGRAGVSGWPAGVEDTRALLPKVASHDLAGSNRWKGRAMALSTSPTWGHGDIWEAFSTSTWQPLSSLWVPVTPWGCVLCAYDANCSFLASICSSAYFLQDFNGTFCGAITVSHSQRSACYLVLLKLSFHRNGIKGHKTKQNRKPEYWFSYHKTQS